MPAHARPALRSSIACLPLQGRKGEVSLAAVQFSNLILCGIAYSIAAGQSGK